MKIYKYKIITLLMFFNSLVMAAPSVVPITPPGSTPILPAISEEFNFNMVDFTGGGMSASYMDLRYNTSTNYLTLEVEFDDRSGADLPDGFQVALSESDTATGMPFGSGDIASVYFDASDPSDIIINAYAYNAQAGDPNDLTNPGRCANSPGSWLNGSTAPNAPDPIFTSQNVAGAASVIEATTSSRTEAGVNYVLYRMVLDATAINTHVPLYRPISRAKEWAGMQFGEELGLWFWGLSNISSTYYDGTGFFPGFLSSFTFDDCLVNDFQFATTNESPVCDSISVTPATVRPDQTVTANVRSTDLEGNDLYVNYVGLPTTATTNVGHGALAPVFNNRAFVNIEWTPTIADIGTNLVEVRFTQDYGVNQATGTCSFTITVDPDAPTDCEEVNTEPTLLKLDGGTAGLATLATSVGRSIRKLRGRVSSKVNDMIDDVNVQHLNAWTEINEVPKIIFLSCVNIDEASCFDISYSENIESYKARSKTMYNSIRKLSRNFRKVINSTCNKSTLSEKLERKCVKAERKRKRILKAAKNLNSFNQNEANNLPTTSLQCFS